MRAIWITSFLLLSTACGSADSGDPAPTTNELAGEQSVDTPKDQGPAPVPMDPQPATPPSEPPTTGNPAPVPVEPGGGPGGEPGAPACFAAPCPPTPPKLHDCDVRKITCQTFAPVVCPDGTVPTVVDSCYGECVPKDQCAPLEDGPGEGVACAAFIEVSDGVCSRKDDDPCRSQDPDCKP